MNVNEFIDILEDTFHLKDIYKEFIRESIFENTSEELPYFADVIIDKVEELQNIEKILNRILKIYSNAAPWHVHIPWPVPIKNFWRSPAFILSIHLSNSSAAWTAWSAVQTETVWPASSHGVAPKFSFGPVALII